MTRELSAASAAEISIIGSMLIDDRCVGDVLTNIREQDFITPRYRAIFAAIRDLFNEGSPVDPVTVLGRTSPGLESLLLECMEVTPTAVNVLHYCGVLREQSALHRVKTLAAELSEASDLATARDLLAQAAGILDNNPGEEVATLQEMMADFLIRMGKTAPPYLPYGLGMLDDMLQTMPGDYVLIGARPSTGKTALALQLALNIAREKRVGFFSLEGSKQKNADRIAAAHTGLDLPKIKRPPLTMGDIQITGNEIAANPALNGSFEHRRAPHLTVAEIQSRTLASKYEVIFIDYVQLISPSARGDRREQMAQVSRDLRAMAQLTNVTVIALAQLRRPDSAEKESKPTLADLKESGQFEQDADAVLLLSRVDPKQSDSDRWLEIAKNKEGYAGFSSRYRFDGRKQRFTYVNHDGTTPEPRVKFEDIEDDGQEEIPFL